MQKQELFHTTNLKAATALLTMGFEKVCISKVRRDDGKESIVFWFNAENAEGMKAATVYNGMTKGGEKLAKSDPENPINYMRCFASNRDELVADIQQTPRMVEIQKDGRRALIAETASDETKRQIAEMI